MLAHLLLHLLVPPLCLAANSSKAGLAWPNKLWVPMGGFTAPSTSLSSYYTWSPEPVIPGARYSSVYQVPFDFIPMLWGCSDDLVTKFNTALDTDFYNVSLTPNRDILGFNEPDLVEQANCTPAAAAKVWTTTLEPLRKKGYRLGSPAVTLGGKEWLQQWFTACNGGCNPDFIPLHWYDLDASDFIAHLNDFHASFNRPIWVTEYAVMNFSGTGIGHNTTSYVQQASMSQIEVFMDVTRAYMDSVDWVERYFFFGAMYDMQGVNPLNTLFDPSGASRRTGALSSLGVQYARSNGSVEVKSTSGPTASKYGGEGGGWPYKLGRSSYTSLFDKAMVLAGVLAGAVCVLL